MQVEGVRAALEHEIAELRARFPHIARCEGRLEQWQEGEAARYSLHLDIRWPQHQSLVSGPAEKSPQAAIEAGLRLAKERLR